MDKQPLTEFIKNANQEIEKIQSEWDMAIGLQLVDNLKPSNYLKELSVDNIYGKKSLKEIELELKNYYTKKMKEQSIDSSEYECDLVSTRIVELLQDNKFELSIDFIKSIHNSLFKEIYDFSGKLRDYNFSKKEIILNGDSALYGDFKTIEESLKYDINLEKKKDYKSMSKEEIIISISDFTSRIWQVHPFKEGNTRTTAIFIEKYLKKLGYIIDNSLFKNKSIYFRNALVRSNYSNRELNIKPTNKYLFYFFENLLLEKNNSLESRDLIVKELTNIH